MQKTIDPILTALDKCGMIYDPSYDLQPVNRGIADKLNWELKIHPTVRVTDDLMECVRDNLPHGVDVDLLN